jgi:hypothetical protein
VGMTTLSDGTILLPFTSGHVENKYTRRTTQTFIARSTDNGVTWDPSSLTTPISLPAPWNGTDVFNATYGRIVDLGSGTLLLPVFGTSTQTPAVGPTNAPLGSAVPYAAGVFRSTDDGLTWSSYTRIGVDPNSQVLYFNGNGLLPTAVAEPTITRLRDGRLLAMLRYDTVLMPQAYFASYSSDGGSTWTDPVKTPLIGRAGTIDQAPCSSDLPAGRSKLVIGYLDFGSLRLTLQQSFDDGAQWRSPVQVQRPSGSPTTGYDFYPDFLELPGNELLVAYTASIPGVGVRIGTEVFQDSNAATWQAEMAADDTATSSTIGLFLKSGDWSTQSWNYSSKYLTTSAASTIASLTAAQASGVSCAVTGVQAYKNGVLLNPALTLAAAGVHDGDTITFAGPAWTGVSAGGFADADGGYLSPSPAFTSDPSIQHQLAGFPGVCDYKIALEDKGRSIGTRFGFPAGQMVTALHLRDADGTPSFAASTFTVWKSPDNKTWYQVPFTLTTTIEPGTGRQILNFTGLNTAGPYLKVNVDTASVSLDLVLNSIRSDIWVTCNVAGNGCAAT